MKQRLYWVDWMKSLGMLFIILGHITPIGYQYLYVFSVPLFFMISGFLGHTEADFGVFWKKSWNNLILPCIVICLMIYPFEALFSWRAGTFELKQVPIHFFNCIIGNQGYKLPAGGLGVCWFIYTLFLCKLLQQIASNKRIVEIACVIACFTIAIWYNVSDTHLHNAIVNTTLAYPFYVIGGGHKYIKINKIPSWLALLMVVVGTLIVLLIGDINGTPWMYDNTYGQNIILFIMGGLLGTYAVFGLSFLLRNLQKKYIDIIAKGTIVILGFHPLFIRFYEHIPYSFRNSFTDYIAGLMILIAFIPIIQIVEKHFHVLLGLRANRSMNISK